MADIIALEQDGERHEHWHFYDLDAARRYRFVRFPQDQAGWLRCFVYWLPIVGDAGCQDRALMEGITLVEDRDAMHLLQAFRRRCGLDPIPDRVFAD